MVSSYVVELQKYGTLGNLRYLKGNNYLVNICVFRVLSEKPVKQFLVNRMMMRRDEGL